MLSPSNRLHAALLLFCCEFIYQSVQYVTIFLVHIINTCQIFAMENGNNGMFESSP